MTQSSRLTVRPRRALLTTAFTSILAAMVPVFGVLYWFAVRQGSAAALAIVIVFNVMVVVAASSAMIRQLMVHTSVDDTELSGNGIFSPTLHVPLDDIGSVHLVETYVGQGVHPTTQFVVCDPDGVCVFRNRGNFWHPGDLRAIADSIPAPLHVISQPLSMAEFFRAYPASAYWFERMPLVRAAATIGAALAALGLTFWIVAVVSP